MIIHSYSNINIKWNFPSKTLHINPCKTNFCIERYDTNWDLGWISWTHLPSTPSSYALCQTFTPKKASQKLGEERNMALRPTFSLYEINPRASLVVLIVIIHLFEWKIKKNVICITLDNLHNKEGNFF